MVVPQGSLGSWKTRRIVGNMFPLLIVLSIIVLWAGITLDDAEEMLEEFAILAVMVPTMVDMGGNLGAILSSRLSTQVHLGTANFDPRNKILQANIIAILGLAGTVFTALAIGAWIIGQVIGSTLMLVELLIIALVSGYAVAVIAVIFSISATYVSFKLGIDPDDTTIPIVTNIVDVFGMVIFIFVAGYVVGFI